MADVTLLGATYYDVPAVDLPKSGGGTARFYDCVDGDLLSYGVRDLVGTATIGSSAICFEDSDPVAGTAVVGTAEI